MIKIKFAAVLFFVVFTACSSGSSSNKGNFSVASSKDTAAVDTGGGGGGGGRDEQIVQQVSLNQAENSQPPIAVERKIIRNAELELEANSSEESQQRITAIAESKGGFVVESKQSISDVRATTRDVVAMTVRVPAAKFNESLDEIRKTANRVIVETIKSDDVTEEFIDIEARIKAQKALEAQFIEIMKRSNSVADALNVQRELAQVRGEIEKVEGRKRFLENQASLSTIKIRLQTPTALSASSSGFFYQLKESLSSGFDFALKFILILITFIIAILPFILFIALPIFLLIRYFWRKQKRQKSVNEIAREELKTE